MVKVHAHKCMGVQSEISSGVLATIPKCNDYASKVFSPIMKVGSNIGPAATGPAGPAPTPLV